MLPVLFLVVVIILPSHFFYVVFRSLYQCVDPIFNAGKSSSLFSGNIQVTLGHFWDVMPYASSWIFLFSGQFHRLLLLVHSMNHPEHLTMWTAHVFTLWWEFSHIVWFRVVLSLSWRILLYFFFYLCMFDGVRFQFRKYLYFSFPRGFWFFFLDLVVLFLLSFVVFPLLIISMAHFSAKFYPYIITVCPHCLFSGFHFLFSFLANTLMSSMYIKSLIFSCDLWRLYTTLHFQSMWLSETIAITNNNGDRASPWKIPLWIYASIKLFSPAVISTSRFEWYFQ